MDGKKIKIGLLAAATKGSAYEEFIRMLVARLDDGEIAPGQFSETAYLLFRDLEQGVDYRTGEAISSTITKCSRPYYRVLWAGLRFAMATVGEFADELPRFDRLGSTI